MNEGGKLVQVGYVVPSSVPIEPISNTPQERVPVETKPGTNEEHAEVEASNDEEAQQSDTPSDPVAFGASTWCRIVLN